MRIDGSEILIEKEQLTNRIPCFLDSRVVGLHAKEPLVAVVAVVVEGEEELSQPLYMICDEE